MNNVRIEHHNSDYVKERIICYAMYSLRDVFFWLDLFESELKPSKYLINLHESD